MPTYVVVGAGPVGRAAAALLAESGHAVTLVSRSGTALAGARVASCALDASDGALLSAVVRGADAVMMCAMAPYDRWRSEFSPIMAGVVAAARANGARIVVLGNIYAYGAGSPATLTPDLPLRPTSDKGRVRQAMWQQALDAGVPVLEVRASDYLGAGAASPFTLLTLPALLAGNPALVLGDPDISHPWTFTLDVARTLAAAVAYEGEWGRAFHVPSQHAPVRQLARHFTVAAGLPPGTLLPLSDAELAERGREDPIMNELLEIAYLYRSANVLAAGETEDLLKVHASSLDTMVRHTLAAPSP
jgi:nucleoside-diphosphate-sugar epimerase